MALAKTSIERNNFTKGLITEATALSFPENAAIDIDNFVLHRDGSVRRRLGFDYETAALFTDSTIKQSVLAGNAVSSFAWKSADNKVNVSIGVIQLGSRLWFVDLFASSQSNALLNGGSSVQLTNDGALISGNKEMQFAPINGKLVVVSEELNQPVKLEYDSDTDTVTTDVISVKVRDTWGVYDSLSPETRPSTLSKEHEYNLYNQGWPNHKVRVAFQADGESQAFTHPVNHTFLQRLWYPANSDVFHHYKMVSADATDPEAIGMFNSYEMQKISRSNSLAPRGRFLLDLFTRGASRETGSGVTGLPADQEDGRLSVVASFANRVFYSGVRSTTTDGDERSPDYAGTLFFSQTVEADNQLANCYQEADPTSEFDPALVATDGGVIKITGAGTVLKLVPFGAQLLVFADNGVWAISGPDDVFRADNFSIRQISTVGCLSAASVVVVESNILFWGEGGIFSVGLGEVSAEAELTNLSETTIQSVYEELSGTTKAYATGIFDSSNRTVRWLYNDTAGYDGITNRNSYNKELVLDATLGAFYVNTLATPSNGAFVASMFKVEDFLTVPVSESVVSDGELVVVNGEEVVVTTDVLSTGNSTVKYLVLSPNTTNNTYDFSFGYYNNTDFLDWGETDPGSVLLTGYELGQDTQRDKQVLYITTHFARTETGFDLVDGELEAILPSSCTVQSQWDFSDSAASNKWSTPFQAYRLNRNYIPDSVADDFDYGYSVITTKTKVRGRGRAVSFKFSSETGKDCQLLGWGMVMTGGQNV